MHGQPGGNSAGHTHGHRLELGLGLGSSWSSAPSFIAVQVDAGDSVHVVPSLGRAVADSVISSLVTRSCASGIPLQLKVVAFDS